MNIFEIVADCRALETLVNEETDPDTGELRELSEEEKESFIQWLDENKQRFETKFDSLYKVYRNKKAEADIAEAEKDTLKTEIDRLRKRADARTNEADRVKGLMGYALDALKMKKFKTALFSIGYQNTRKSAKQIPGFFNPDVIPTEFLRRELNTTAINQAIDEGRLYEKDGMEFYTKLFYRENGEEKELKGVSYIGGTALVIR